MAFSNLCGTQIRDAIVMRNPLVTKWFFYEKCYPLLSYNIKIFFKNKIKYDDYVNAIYIYLMEDGARRFMSYDGTGDICSWMKPTVYHLTLSIIEKNTLIEDVSKEHPYDGGQPEKASYHINFTLMDLELLLNLLEKENKTYAFVLRRVFFDDADADDLAKELNTNKSNIYNIKSRALRRIISYL